MSMRTNHDDLWSAYLEVERLKYTSQQVVPPNAYTPNALSNIKSAADAIRVNNNKPKPSRVTLAEFLESLRSPPSTQPSHLLGYNSKMQAHINQLAESERSKIMQANVEAATVKVCKRDANNLLKCFNVTASPKLVFNAPWY